MIYKIYDNIFTVYLYNNIIYFNWVSSTQTLLPDIVNSPANKNVLNFCPATRKELQPSSKLPVMLEVWLSWTANFFLHSHVSLFSLFSPSLSLSHFFFFCSDINILLVANGANVDWYFHYKSPQSHAQLYLWFPNWAVNFESIWHPCPRLTSEY